MRLVERHIVTKNHPYFEEMDAISFLSKNLYNRANYIIRQEFIETSKQKELGLVKNAKWIRYNELQKMLQNSKDVDYYALPTKVSQKVLQNLDKNWQSFFVSIKDWKKFPSKYTGQPSLPKYKDKVNGRNLLIYTIQAISKPKLKQGIVQLSGTKISVQTKQENIKQARIVPKNNHYVVEIVFERKEKHENVNKKKIAGADLGINNLITVTSNQNSMKPILINGRPLKSMNQYYNKKKAILQSFVPNKSSNKLRALTDKRNFKVDDYLHNASKIVVDYLVENEVGIFVIGNNKQWKTEINLGKRNNQNFVNIPHSRLIKMIEYKCKLVGIEVYLREESYTSKCSFIDNEPIKKHETYLGKRVKRGLFVSVNGTKINADCNGAGNSIRKAFPNSFDEGIEGVVVRPVTINLKRGHRYKKAK